MVPTKQDIKPRIIITAKEASPSALSGEGAGERQHERNPQSQNPHTHAYTTRSTPDRIWFPGIKGCFREAGARIQRSPLRRFRENEGNGVGMENDGVRTSRRRVWMGKNVEQKAQSEEYNTNAPNFYRGPWIERRGLERKVKAMGDMQYDGGCWRTMQCNKS